MARLGYLYLNNGGWEGKQIVSAEWINAATTQYFETDAQMGFGYQWWIDLARRAYLAQGSHGQIIFVSPDRNLVVITTANLPAEFDPIYRLIDEYILPSIQPEN